MTAPQSKSAKRTVVKWIFVVAVFVITAGTVVNPLVSVPGFITLLVAIALTVAAGVGVWISVPSPPRITRATVVLSMVVVVAASGTYLNLDAATRAFGLRSVSAATANILSRYATVTISTYAPDGLPVTIHNRALSPQYVTVAIEARGPDGIVIDSDRQRPRMGPREERRIVFFRPPSARTGSSSDTALDVREKYMQSATFAIVFAETKDVGRRTTR